MRSTLHRTAAKLAATALMILATVPALAADVEGVLTLRWGDPLDGSDKTERLQAEIVSKRGYTYPISAEQALEDGLPLFDLAGREVVAAIDERRKSDAGYRLVGVAAKSGSGPEPVVDGRPWVNLLCKFADITDEPTSVARIDAAFAPDGGMTSYFQKVSGGFVDLGRSRSLGWFVLPNPRSTYVDANGNPNLSRLLNDCIAAAGEALVDQVGTEDHAGINVLVNGSLGCCAWGGSARATIGDVNRTWRVTWAPPAAYQSLSLLAHEIAHALGLPHSNNSDRDGSTYDNPWDLLSDSTGHAVRDDLMGRNPKMLSAHQLDRNGWLGADERRVIAGDVQETVRLQRLDVPAAGAVRMLRLEAPQWTDGRFVTIEARVRNGAQDAALPDEGVLIYDVDPRRSQPGWLVDVNDPAATYSNGRSVVFKPGDRYIAPDRSFELRVLAADADGFQVEVVMPGPGFGSGFE
jgi:M6 family metalloprotease-like protein